MRYMEFLSTLRWNKVSIFSRRDIENIIDTASSYIVAAGKGHLLGTGLYFTKATRF